MEKMKVLWYISRDDLGKVGNAATIHSREDVQGLQNCGWDVTLFGKAGENCRDQTGIKEHIVQRSNLHFQLFYYLLFEFKMVFLLMKTRKKPDFVFFRGPTDSFIIGKYLKFKGCPFGMELNGVFQYRYEKKKNLYHWLQMVSDRFFMKNCDVLIPVTEELELIAKNEAKPGCIISVARNGVNPDKIKPYFKTIIDKRFEFKIGYLGKCYQYRGHELALNLVAELKKRGVIIGFVFVGGGPNISKLKELSNKLKIINQIEFIDEVPPENMGKYVADCDLMWAYFDDWDRYKLTGGSPLKVWTYLSLGKPVLLRDPGVLEHYKNIPGIFWFKGKKKEELAEYVINLFDGKKSSGLKNIGLDGREYIIKNVSWKNHVDIINKSIIKYYKK
jgi:glycosyltransferase involved in cell wall biosynthesis